MSFLKDYLVRGYANAIVDLAVFIKGVMLPAEELIVFSVTKSFTVPVGFDRSEAYAQLPPLTGTVLTVYKNESTLIGTITFSAGVRIGVFESVSAISLIEGDRLSIHNQLTVDTTSDISVTIRGEL